MSILPSIVDRSSLLVRLYEYLSSNRRSSGAYLFIVFCQSTLFTVPSNAHFSTALGTGRSRRAQGGTRCGARSVAAPQTRVSRNSL